MAFSLAEFFNANNKGKKKAPPAQTVVKPKQSFGNKLVDIVSPNTQADQYRRQTNGQEQMYRNVGRGLIGGIDRGIKGFGRSTINDTLSGTIIEPLRSVTAQTTGNNKAMQAAELRKNNNLGTSATGMMAQPFANLIKNPINAAAVAQAQITGNRTALRNNTIAQNMDLGLGARGTNYGNAFKKTAGDAVSAVTAVLTPGTDAVATRLTKPLTKGITSSLGKNIINTTTRGALAAGEGGAYNVAAAASSNPELSLKDAKEAFKGGAIFGGTLSTVAAAPSLYKDASNMRKPPTTKLVGSKQPRMRVDERAALEAYMDAERGIGDLRPSERAVVVRDARTAAKRNNIPFNDGTGRNTINIDRRFTGGPEKVQPTTGLVSRVRESIKNANSSLGTRGSVPLDSPLLPVTALAGKVEQLGKVDPLDSLRQEARKYKSAELTDGKTYIKDGYADPKDVLVVADAKRLQELGNKSRANFGAKDQVTRLDSGDKLSRFEDFYKNNNRIKAPALATRSDGSIAGFEGNHRLRVLSDKNNGKVVVSVSPESIDVLKKQGVVTDLYNQAKAQQVREAKIGDIPGLNKVAQDPLDSLRQEARKYKSADEYSNRADTHDLLHRSKLEKAGLTQNEYASLHQSLKDAEYEYSKFSDESSQVVIDFLKNNPDKKLTPAVQKQALELNNKAKAKLDEQSKIMDRIKEIDGDKSAYDQLTDLYNQANKPSLLDKVKNSKLMQDDAGGYRGGSSTSERIAAKAQVGKTDPVKQAKATAQKTEALKKQGKITPKDDGYWSTPIKGEPKAKIPDVKDINGVTPKEGDTIKFSSLLGDSNGKTKTGTSKVTWVEPTIANASGKRIEGYWSGNGRLDNGIPFEVVKPKSTPTSSGARAVLEANGVSAQPQRKLSKQPSQTERTRPVLESQPRLVDSTSSLPEGNTSFDASKYVKQQTKLTEQAGKSTGGKFSKLRKEIATKGIDALSAIEKPVEKAVGGRDANFPLRDKLDRSLRSGTIAGQYIKDGGLDRIIQDVPDLKEFDQYLIAKHGAELEANGVKTGRALDKDAQLVEAYSPKYEAQAKALGEYNNKLLDKTVDYGLISKETADYLKEKYPNYVPFERIFTDQELLSKGVGAGPASLSTQSVIQRIKGSERAIKSPTESILSKTNDVIAQGERNQAARAIAETRNLSDNPLALKEIKASDNIGNKPTISYLDNGVKRTFETTPEVAAAAKSLNKEQMGLIGTILSYPTRTLRLGATGVNVGFAAANVTKDLATAFVNSRHPAKASIANPKVFLKALGAAFDHDSKAYQELVREGAGGTSFDIGRNQTTKTIKQIRAEKNLGTSIKYTVTHPGQLLKVVEDTIGRSEEFGRAVQYFGNKDVALKAGKGAREAVAYGADAARNNTVNFARAGEYGRVLNSVLPYFNAGLQGARTLNRNIRDRPAQTGAKLVITAFAPMAATTAWNIGSPERKEAYDNLQDYEKEGNFIIVPPNPKKDELGRWNVIKIPLPNGVSNLASVVRNGVEELQGADNFDFGAMAGNLAGASSSVNLNNPRQAVGQVIPQGLKPVIEGLTNKNLFTGNDIVPYYDKDKPKPEQFSKNTSGIARIIGRNTNTSPQQIDNFIKTTTGGAGQNAVNIADNILARNGVIKPEEIRGRSLEQSVTNRFSSGQGKSDYQVDKERTTKFNKSGSSVMKLSGGKILTKVNGENKTYDNQEQADVATGKKKIAFKGNDVYIKAKNKAGFTTKAKNEYEYDNEKSDSDLAIDRARSRKDVNAWYTAADKKINAIDKYKKTLDKDTDKVKINSLTKAQEDLIDEAMKYKGYGNSFTKGRSTGKGRGKGKGGRSKAYQYKLSDVLGSSQSISKSLRKLLQEAKI